jgi:enediyne biosynthesis protein E4
VYRKLKWRSWSALIAVLTLAALQPVPVVTVTSSPLTASACSGRFVWHELDHITTVPGGDEVRMFEANGSGLAINDLDNDSDLDIVLGNHAGEDTILWNEGLLNFTTERMIFGNTRSVSTVDLDADGWMDIVFTRRASAPNYWHNTGNRVFERGILPGISPPLYSINWADFDNDSDLDLVGATYDAGLLSDLGQNFLMSRLSGVYYFEHRDQVFRATQLANEAQGLALVVMDFNADSHLDFVVGNDFAAPDMAWQWAENGWKQTNPFTTTTYSTMSFDSGDLDNNGRDELFAADMKPYTDDLAARTVWQRIRDSVMNDPLAANNSQVTENALQTIDEAASQFVNVAQDSGVDATGWSWSSKFGDLDQDGFLDLYVVNGMIEKTIFAELPAHELLEENLVFRNDGHRAFNAMPDWGLNSSASGRGMSMGDLDGDGDLDIVVNNLRSPAQLFENQLCTGSNLLVDLFWPTSRNTRAIGASLELYTSSDTFYRQVKASSGYLSGDPARLHFGFPTDTILQGLKIRWPDGVVSLIENPLTHSYLSITR